MIQVPEGFTTGLLIEPGTNGNILVGFAKDGVLLGDYTLSPLDVANMAAAMLAASKDESGKLPPRDENDTKQSGALVAPSSFALGPGRIPGEHALIFSFGQSHLALPLHLQTLKSLGEGMLALAAGGRVQ